MPKININKNLCKGCSLCVKACPKKIVKLSETKMNDKGYYIAELTDENMCTGCSSCAIMCPDLAITVER